MDYRPLPIGISDFAEMIQKDFYYVDKTDKKYDTDLRNDGYKYVSYYGIAFCGKECVVHCKPCEYIERKR